MLAQAHLALFTQRGAGTNFKPSRWGYEHWGGRGPVQPDSGYYLEVEGNQIPSLVCFSECQNRGLLELSWIDHNFGLHN
ncbi:hypothetical protein RRG08_048437 [Elysia crispata]|uniref:Uncharacterized protein n=1 Tax=Elysia crispata TaxID=231223 RepID=A0AAE1B9L3_9GAST|nr:hypothetical protein RRG08_048437 [Elysia crispata]